MWCPVCKNEYKEGYTVCADCNVPLVEELVDPKEVEMVELVSTEKKNLLEDFAKYLEYSGITTYEIEPDEYELVWTMSVMAKDVPEAKKLLKGFVIANSERKANEARKAAEAGEADEAAEADDFDESDEIDGMSPVDESDDFFEGDPEETIFDPDEEEEEGLTFNAHTSSYVRKKDRYTEYRFSAYTCFIVGFLGAIFCVLNIMGIFSFVPALFSQIVLLVVFVLFIIGGFVMLSTSSKIKAGIKDEQNVETELNEWLKLNVTPEYINEITDQDVSDEVNYFNYTEKINARIHDVFPDAPDEMIESLVDDHLSTIL